MILCCDCGSHEATVIPLERRGLKRAKQYTGKAFCWACWYHEVANSNLYNGKNSLGLRDGLIYDQIHRLNSKALPRMSGKSSISGRTGKLTFDHIKPLFDGGDHTAENLRPALFFENLVEEALYCAQDEAQRLKILARVNYQIVWNWQSEAWRCEVAA
jgi:5-methylcytosine-specific restriction endonuclease McrA